MSYSDFKSFMQEENIPIENFNKMIEQMKYLVKISFKSVGNKLLRITVYGTRRKQAENNKAFPPSL